ncbi:MAG TPA: heme-binding domain-containing protein [Ignavibacteriales bacterium]|nr:heme-binding domain-containing protein [Ignavibacteriales bacterium]
MTERKKNIIKWILIGIVILIVVIQFVPVKKDDPPVATHIKWDSPRTEALARGACYDCHSNETQWPYYSHIAPVSWFLSDHVHEGRRHLNFSQWNYPRDREIKKARGMIRQIREGEMPLDSYTWMHPPARLTDQQKQELIAGIEKTFNVTAPTGKDKSSGGEHEEDHDEK